MRKFNDVYIVSLKKNILYLNESQIFIGLIVDDWFLENIELKFSIERAHYTNDIQYLTLTDYSGLEIVVLKGLVHKINIYPYTYQNSPHFKGEIYIEENLLEIPFKSNNIEKYFPKAEVPKPPNKLINRFLPRDIIKCPIDIYTEIEISISRSPDLVGCISIKKVSI